MEKWRDEEIEYLKSSSNRKTLKDVSEHLRRSKSSVRHKAERLGITLASEVDMWSDSEVEWIKENFDDSTYKDMARKLKRPVESVKHKSYSLGLSKGSKKSRKWSEWEENYLQKFYSTKGVDCIAKRLDRTEASVKKKASSLGISILDESISFKELSRTFKVDFSVIHRWKDKFGMPYKSVKRGKSTYYIVDIKEFWKWVENNKDVIPWKNYEKFSLPPQPEFVCDGVNKSCNIIDNHRKPISKILRKRINTEYAKGKSIKELAECYGRTEYSIKHIIRDAYKIT